MSNIPAINTTVNPIYEAFKDSGVTPALVALIGCKAFVCLVGVVLNMDMVYITCKSKTLRGACNLQIALNAMSISIQESSSFVTFIVVVTGINFIPLRICGIIQFLPLFCTIFTTGNTLSIGIDRLISVISPLWYIQLDRDRRYLTLIVIIISMCSLSVATIGLMISLQSPSIPVMCTVIDPLQNAFVWVNQAQLLVNCSSVVCYLLVWAILALRKSTIMKQKQVNTFKSLSMILLLEVFGWISHYIIRIFLGSVNIQLHTWYLVNIATILPYLSISISPLVLYIFSVEYRKAFLCQFGVIGPTTHATAVNVKNISFNRAAAVHSSQPTSHNLFLVASAPTIRLNQTNIQFGRHTSPTRNDNFL